MVRIQLDGSTELSFGVRHAPQQLIAASQPQLRQQLPASVIGGELRAEFDRAGVFGLRCRRCCRQSYSQRVTGKLFQILLSQWRCFGATLRQRDQNLAEQSLSRRGKQLRLSTEQRPGRRQRERDNHQSPFVRRSEHRATAHGWGACAVALSAVLRQDPFAERASVNSPQTNITMARTNSTRLPGTSTREATSWFGN